MIERGSERGMSVHVNQSQCNDCWTQEYSTTYLTLYYISIIAFIAIAVTIIIKLIAFLTKEKQKKQKNTKNTIKRIIILFLIELDLFGLMILFRINV